MSVAYHPDAGRIDVGDFRPGDLITVTIGPSYRQRTEECRLVRASSGSLILVPLPEPDSAA